MTSDEDRLRPEVTPPVHPAASAPSHQRTRVGGRAVATGFHFRDALRHLFILVEGSEPLPTQRTTEAFDRVFCGEKRALAIDFLVRYPDYLADELLNCVAADGRVELLPVVRSIFDRDEPDVRLVSMIRWRRGAYHNLDNSLSILASRQLVQASKVKTETGIVRHEFLTGPSARAFLTEALVRQPILTWYRDRTRLAMTIAGARSGTDLKQAQYENPEYSQTPYGALIPSIKDRVLARLRSLEIP